MYSEFYCPSYLNVVIKSQGNTKCQTDLGHGSSRGWYHNYQLAVSSVGRIAACSKFSLFRRLLPKCRCRRQGWDGPVRDACDWELKYCRISPDIWGCFATQIKPLTKISDSCRDLQSPIDDYATLKNLSTEMRICLLNEAGKLSGTDTTQSQLPPKAPCGKRQHKTSHH